MASSPTWGRLTGLVAEAPKVERPDPHFVLPDCRVGLEFEFEGFNAKGEDHPTPRGFEAHRDNSLRNNGIEFVFSKPMFGTALHAAISDMIEFAKKYKLQTPNRAGFHVHVDMRDSTVAQIRAFFSLYALVEPFLYKFVGDGRDASNFCLPWYSTPDAALSALRVLNDLEASEAGPLAGRQALRSIGAGLESKRYSGLNVAALGKYGSLEFRQMRATIDYQRIVDWINIIFSIKKYSKDNPLSGPDLLNRASALGIRGFHESVFGAELAGRIRVKTVSPEKAHGYGMRTVFDLSIASSK